MVEHKRFFGLPIGRGTGFGEVPGGEVPSITKHNGHEPKSDLEFERLTTELNGGKPLPIIVEEMEKAKKAGIPLNHFILKVPFRDSEGWKIMAGVAGVTMTAGAALGIYQITKKILKARNDTHK